MLLFIYDIYSGIVTDRWLWTRYSLYSVYYTVNCIWNDRTRFHHCVISCAGYSCDASGRTQHHVNKQSIQEYSTENIWELS